MMKTMKNNLNSLKALRAVPEIKFVYAHVFFFLPITELPFL